MKKFLLLLVFVSGAYSSSVAYAEENPQFPLVPPADLRLVHFSKVSIPGHPSSKTKEVFVSQGIRWRSEGTKPNRKIAVIVFDGQRIHSNSTKEDQRSELYDWRYQFKSILTASNQNNYKGFRQFHSYQCWYFTPEENGRKYQIWVDTQMHIPRKWIIDEGNGKRESDYFFDFKTNLSGKGNIFSTETLRPILMKYVSMDWSVMD